MMISLCIFQQFFLFDSWKIGLWIFLTENFASNTTQIARQIPLKNLAYASIKRPGRLYFLKMKIQFWFSTEFFQCGNNVVCFGEYSKYEFVLFLFWLLFWFIFFRIRCFSSSNAFRASSSFFWIRCSASESVFFTSFPLESSFEDEHCLLWTFWLRSLIQDFHETVVIRFLLFDFSEVVFESSRTSPKFGAGIFIFILRWRFSKRILFSLESVFDWGKPISPWAKQECQAPVHIQTSGEKNIISIFLFSESKKESITPRLSRSFHFIIPNLI